jgi:uncharacterized membrane protein
MKSIMPIFALLFVSLVVVFTLYEVIVVPKQPTSLNNLKEVRRYIDEIPEMKEVVEERLNNDNIVTNYEFELIKERYEDLKRQKQTRDMLGLNQDN